MTMRARFNTLVTSFWLVDHVELIMWLIIFHVTWFLKISDLEKVITDDGTIYNRPNAENKNADFSASVETAFR